MSQGVATRKKERKKERGTETEGEVYVKMKGKKKCGQRKMRWVEKEIKSAENVCQRNEGKGR